MGLCSYLGTFIPGKAGSYSIFYLLGSQAYSQNYQGNQGTVTGDQFIAQDVNEEEMSQVDAKGSGAYIIQEIPANGLFGTVINSQSQGYANSQGEQSHLIKEISNGIIQERFN
jgi:hypothetical protein